MSMLTYLRKWLNRLFAEEEAVLLLLLIFAVLSLVVWFGNVLAPVIASLILAYLVQGVSAQLTVRGLPQWLGISVAFLLFIGTVLAVLLVLLPLVWQQLTKFIVDLPRMMTTIQHALLLLPEQTSQLITEQQIKEWVSQAGVELGRFGQAVVSVSLASVPMVVGAMIYLVLVPILVFFFLKDRQQILDWMATFLPRQRPLMTRIWHEMNQQIANYVRGKAIEIVIVGAVSYICFAWMSLDFAALLALLVGLSVVIPYIGATAVTIPVAMVGYFQWGWSADFMYLMVVYLIIQALDGNVLVPLLFSEAVNLHPVAIIMAVLLFGGLWGFWGVFFAIPLATLIKAVLNAWPSGDEMQVEVAK